ncbi:hypothetical protein JCM19237_5183 [Photobacterium aphoticum]|uniref:Uncharacterized protein n=1 Tax=Photobacterium aphoticum TaxID=754436 RepID=A0A090QGM1_9GAMM|nr:hypothetical protein JCM19237_5183 [Photobacterium aphoticum]
MNRNMFNRPLRLVPLCLLALSVSPVVLANNVLPDNEKICMKEMEILLGQQQVIFSDSQTQPEVRRLAERAIDVSREAFSKNGSYCEAQQALQAMDLRKENVLELKKGEINYFGRSML